MIPKSLSSTPIGDGNRFSEKIMRKANNNAVIAIVTRRSRNGGRRHKSDKIRLTNQPAHDEVISEF